jgi:hypothetical protein
MSMVAKILVVLNLILAVAFMGAAGAYVNSAENHKKTLDDRTIAWEANRKELDESLRKSVAALDAANSARAAAEQQAAASEASMKAQEANHNLLKSQLDKYNATLASLTSAQENIKSTLDAANARNESLQRDKDAAEGARREALDAKNAAETEQSRLQAEIANLSSMVDGLKVQVTSMNEALDSTSTELAMYKEKYAPPTAMGAPVKGIILAADNKMDIYLVSVGSKDQVKVNDTMTVYRNGSFIAEVVVDQVFEDKAAVYVKKLGGSPLKKGDIKQGDQVSNIL